MDDAEALLKKKLKKKELSKENLEKLKSNNKDVLKAKDLYLQMLKYNENQDTYRKFNKNLKKSLDTRLNPDFKNREEIVGDDVDDLNDTIYGNPEVDARGPYHGTSVAGLVAALNDDKGIDGVARHVKIMVLRMVPNGDERDKDVALAIRYAVENGASIINCSFAKKYGMHAEFVELVTQEALDNDVLIVHGSGNYGTNNDSIPYHPEGRLNNGEWAPNWINVGASQSKDDEHLVAVFSNYGKESVDVLAPGVQIRSLALGDKYSMGSGTSLSAPILSGVAAVIKSYFPHLTASQLKEVILESAYQPKTTELNKPGLSKSDEEKKLVPLTDLFATPGIVNLYRAIKLAEEKYPAQPKEQASDEK